MLRSAREPADFELSYSPGWFDRLTEWIDRMPGSNAAWCLGLLVLQLGYLTAALWLTGRRPVGTIDFGLVFFVVVTPYFLWVRFHLDAVASAALDAFRPALEVSHAEFRRLRYELTTLSARTTWIVTALAVVGALANVMLLPSASLASQYSSTLGVALVIVGPVGLSTMAVVAVSTAQALHQLRMVQRIHELAGKIDLFRSKPLYAFSGLTARTGVSFLLVAYYVAAVRPDLVHYSPALEALLLAIIPTAIACFVVPLRGMHRRLAAEKNRLLMAATSRFEVAFARLNARVDEGNLQDADKVNMQISSLVTERDTIARISTWPWEPATLTGFLTALVLPGVLWVVQRMLERAGF
jgi:hypothetical protein